VTQGVVTYEVTAALVIPPGAPRPAPGMSGNGQIITETRNGVVAIPPRAIRRQGTEQVVDVRRNNTVQEQVVVTGLSDTNNVEIISGLNEGDVIVVPLLVTGSASDQNKVPTLPSGIR
jgi:macrolide-specific efflux system membrane fusion protein